MGVEYRGVLVVGYDIDELETIAANAGVDDEDFDELSAREKAETLGMAKFSPYYDADYTDCIYGRLVARSDDYSANRVSYETLESVKPVVEAMHKEFGFIPDIYIMAEGT